MAGIVTIIGSRKTPNAELNFIKETAKRFGLAGWTLRSGGAEGADKAGEDGFDEVQGDKEIYLPWKGFRGSTSYLIAPEFPNWKIAVHLMLYLHPNKNAIKNKPQTIKLLARDAYQVLGGRLNNPTDLIVCWTPEGQEIGGTAAALRICRWYKEETNNEIPIINIGALGIEKARQLIDNYI